LPFTKVKIEKFGFCNWPKLFQYPIIIWILKVNFIKFWQSEPASHKCLVKSCSKGRQIEKVTEEPTQLKGVTDTCGLGGPYPFNFCYKSTPSKCYLEEKFIQRKQGSRHPTYKDCGMDTINSKNTHPDLK